MKLRQALVPAGAGVTLGILPTACAPIYNATCKNTLVTSNVGPITDPAAFAGTACNAPPPSEIQGDAVGFRDDGKALATVSEGAGQTLHLSTVP